MTVIKEIISDVKSGKLTAAEKVIIGILAFLLVLSFIFFGVIFKKVKDDKNNQYTEKIDALDSSNREKDKYIFALQRNLSEKDLRIDVYKQRDSSLQQIAITNNYLLNKLNEKDAQISHHVNRPDFTKDSLRSVIGTNY